MIDSVYNFLELSNINNNYFKLKDYMYKLCGFYESINIVYIYIYLLNNNNKWNFNICNQEYIQYLIESKLLIELDNDIEEIFKNNFNLNIECEHSIQRIINKKNYEKKILNININLIN